MSFVSFVDRKLGFENRDFIALWEYVHGSGFYS